jgi:ribosomal protein L7/L12
MEKYMEVVARAADDFSNPIASRNSILRLFHDAGLSMAEAIKGIRFLFKISLSDAKNIVAESPIWAVEANAGKEMQAEAFTVFNDAPEYEGRRSPSPRRG